MATGFCQALIEDWKRRDPEGAEKYRIKGLVYPPPKR